MSITFNATNYNTSNINITTSHTTNALLLNDLVTPPAVSGSVVLYCTNVGSITFRILTPNGNGGILFNPTVSTDLTVPENNAVIATNVNAITLSNKTINSADNTINPNFLQNIPISLLPQVNTYITYNSIAGEWRNSAYSNGGTTFPYWTFDDIRPTGTSGGNSNGGFINRIINLNASQSSTSTVVTNPTTTTISFNQVGSYYVHALTTVSAIGGIIYRTKIYLADSTVVTNYYISGISQTLGPENQTIPLLGVIKVATPPIVCTLRCYNTYNGANGLGVANSITGVNEIYTVMHVRQISDIA